MSLRDVICLQVPHCLSCPLNVWLTGKDCHDMSELEIEEAVKKAQEDSEK